MGNKHELHLDGRPPHSVLLSLLRQAIKFGQLLGIAALAEVEWPSLSRSSLRAASAGGTSLTGLAGTACLDARQSAALELGALWCAPTALLVLVLPLAALLSCAIHCTLAFS